MKNFSIIKVVTLSVGLMSCAVMFTGCGAKKINLNDYLDINYSGYDTVGVATAEFDYEKMIKENSEAFGIKGEPSEMEILNVELALDGVIDGSLSKSTELSNGDSISYVWDVSMTDKISEKYDVEFSFEDVKVDVKNLDATESFDPFANVNVTYSGIAPDGSVKIDGSVDGMSDLYFEADKTSGLKNGDTIKVSVKSYSGDVESYCTEHGKIPSELEKEFTVEGLSSYVSSIDEIPEDMQEKMKNQAMDSITANAAGWAEGNSLESAEFIGYYFLTPKDGFYASSNNELYCVYKVTSNITGFTADNTEEKQTGQETYYTYYHYSDIMILEDGTCSADLSNGYMTNNNAESSYGQKGFFGGIDAYSYKGYNDLDSMFNDCVTKKIADCNYESTVQ